MLGQKPCTGSVHNCEKFGRPWRSIDFPRARLPKNVAPQHDRDLDLLLWNTLAVGASRSRTMFHPMPQGAKGANVEGTRLLQPTDAVPVHLYLQNAAPENCDSKVEKGRSAVCVPVFRPLGYFEDLHRSINECIVRKILLQKTFPFVSRKSYCIPLAAAVRAR